MKLIIRISALTLVLASAAAASVSSSSSTGMMASSQAASARLPIPTCGPGVPHCPTQSGPTR